jgi:hypothetical protein
MHNRAMDTIQTFLHWLRSPGAISPVSAGLIGAIAAHLLTRSRDRGNWIRDSRIAEWRELLRALTASHIIMLRLAGKNLTAAQNEQWTDAKAEVATVQSDRILISADLAKVSFNARWHEAIAYVEKTGDPIVFSTMVLSLVDSMVKAAIDAK